MVPMMHALCKGKYAYYTYPMERAPRPPPRKKPGPVPRLGPVVQSHVYVPEDLFEWAKHQEEGFSALVRKLLLEERKRRTQSGVEHQATTGE
jgi:hypothetical protein